LETAIKTHPSYATAHENLGDIYARMASEAYDKALQLDNGNTRAQNKLSLIKEIFSSTGKPIQLASKSSPTSKEAAAPVSPIRPAEPAKPLESKPVTPKAAEPEKATETPKPEPKEAAVAEDEDKEITLAVQDWAKAWSSKKVDKYLASYGDNFQTPNGESRKEWEDLRRERITKPTSINVEITKVHIKMESPNQARVSFKQNYRAGSLAKRTSKTLMMQKAGDKWYIEQELADR
jgi:ketosteroid isomerase-like protein